METQIVAFATRHIIPITSLIVFLVSIAQEAGIVGDIPEPWQSRVLKAVLFLSLFGGKLRKAFIPEEPK